MFDVAWQEILVVGIVALIVVGPKELPTLLRTIGKYVGLIKRQASEFRAQFDEAMRESEIEQLRKDVENIKTSAESSLRDVERSVDTEMSGVRKELGDVAQGISSVNDPSAMHDANGVPFAPHDALAVAAEPVTGGAGAAAIAAAAAAAPPPSGGTAPSPAKPGA
jgi:sec-independent protein translocase protein TatB